MKTKTKIEKQLKKNNNKKNIDDRGGISVGTPQDFGFNDNYIINFRDNMFVDGDPEEYFDDEGESEENSEDSDGMDEDTTVSVKRPRGRMKKRRKVTVKPIDVLNELEVVPSNWSLEGIDGKIEMLKDKEELISYVGGLTKILKGKLEIQSILK